MVSKEIHLNTRGENGKPCYVAYNTDPDFQDFGDANQFLKASLEITKAMESTLFGFSCKFRRKRRNEGIQVIEVYGPHAARNCECLAVLVANRMNGQVVAS